jgi:hypothetical protein
MELLHGYGEAGAQASGLHQVLSYQRYQYAVGGGRVGSKPDEISYTEICEICEICELCELCVLSVSYLGFSGVEVCALRICVRTHSLKGTAFRPSI